MRDEARRASPRASPPTQGRASRVRRRGATADSDRRRRRGSSLTARRRTADDQRRRRRARKADEPRAWSSASDPIRKPRLKTAGRGCLYRRRIHGRSTRRERGTTERSPPVMRIEMTDEKVDGDSWAQRRHTIDRPTIKANLTTSVNRCEVCFRRTGWDSNPRYAFDVHKLSRPAP